MRVYVAGPMTGYPEWNFPAFEDATTRLRAAGFEVTSPHEIDLEGGFDPHSDGAEFDLRAALERDVAEVLAADGVALLDGWEASPGAAIEVLTAESKGAPARPVSDWLRGLVTLAAAVAALSGALGVAKSPGVAETVEVASAALVETVEAALRAPGDDERILSEDRRYRVGYRVA